MTDGRLTVLLVLLVALATPGNATSLVQADLLAMGDGLLTVQVDSGLEWLDVDQTTGVSFVDIALHNAGGWRDLGFRHASIEEVRGLFAAAGISERGSLSVEDFGAAAQLLDLLGCTTNCDTDRRAQLGFAVGGHGTLFGFGPTAVVFVDGDFQLASVEVDFSSGLGGANAGDPAAFGGFDFLGGRFVFSTGGLEKTVMNEIDASFTAEGVGHYLVRAVPEPATALLLLLGLVPLALRR